MLKKIILLVLLVFILVGCAPVAYEDRSPVPMTEPYTIVEDGMIHRYYDAEADVVCWWFAFDGGYNGEGGLSCLPRSQTNLSAE